MALASILGNNPLVSSIADTIASAADSIVNDPGVKSAAGSIISEITSGGNTQAPSQSQPPSQQSASAASAAGGPTSPPEPTATPTVPAVQSVSDANNGSLQPNPSGTQEVSSSKSSNNIGAIVGGVIGGLVALAVLGALLWFCRRRRKRGSMKPVRSREQMFENECFDHVDGTPGLVDPYATGADLNRDRASTLLSSDSSQSHYTSPHSHSTPTSFTTPNLYSYHNRTTPQSPIVTKAMMAGHAPPPPMTESHVSIPATITTAAGTFGPGRRSTDTGFSDEGKYNVARSNTMTSTMSHHHNRPLPTVPLSPTSAPTSNWSHSQVGLPHHSYGHHPHQFPPTVPPPPHGAPVGLGISHPGPLTPYPEESGGTVVEHAVDAGTLGPRKEMLPPMYDPAWYTVHGQGRPGARPVL